MLNSLTGKHFETHQDTSIEFHPGVNTFVGESDEGKSGIVRQIKWNSRNRPQGDSYRNDELSNKKEDKLKVTEVGIDYKDSGHITRARDGFAGGINHYVIKGQEDDPLRALRTDIPDEVQEVTRMSEVNIQGQHPTEQYFLLADKPGPVAKEFNKVAGLTIMDKAKADINSQVRACNAVITIAKKEIETRTEDLEDSEWILKAKKLADQLVAFGKKVDAKQNEWETISETLRLIQNLDWQLTTFYGTEEALKALEALNKENQDIESKEDDLKHIKDLIGSIKEVNTNLLSTTDTDKALNVLKELKTFGDNIKEDELKMDKINILVYKITNMDAKIQIAEIEYKEAKRDYDTIWAKEDCPTCGRKGK